MQHTRIILFFLRYEQDKKQLAPLSVLQTTCLLKHFFTFSVLLIDALRNLKNCFTINVRYIPWLPGAKISVLRNEPFVTESIFREACLLSTSLVAYDPHRSRMYVNF